MLMLLALQTIDTSNLIQKRKQNDYETKTGEIEKKILDHTWKYSRI